MYAFPYHEGNIYFFLKYIEMLSVIQEILKNTNSRVHEELPFIVKIFTYLEPERNLRDSLILLELKGKLKILVNNTVS